MMVEETTQNAAAAKQQQQPAAEGDGGESKSGEEPKEDTAEAFAKELLGEAPNEQKVVVKLRNKKPPAGGKANGTAAMHVRDASNAEEERAQQNGNGTATNDGVEVDETVREILNGSTINADTVALLQRTMGALYEMNPELEDSHEEIRKLDSQLDHLNDYMDRVEERLKVHNDKIMETLRQQREDREKRRQSFHERLEQNRQEDDDFQRQLSSVLRRVDSLRGSQGQIEREQAPKDNE